MRRRYHKRRWTLVCFFTVMLILPAAAVIPKSGGRSSAYPYAKETGTSPADATCWNVASDGYGWEEESVTAMYIRANTTFELAQEVFGCIDKIEKADSPDGEIAFVTAQ